MTATFTDRLALAVHDCRADAAQTDLILRAIADTVACAAAGWDEPVSHKARTAYGGTAATLWSGEGADSAEAAVMLNAVAAHALDFDDVCLESTAHVSASVVPTVLVAGRGDAPDAVVNAYAAGHLTARAMGARLGQGHYQAGWHGTGTVGAFACAAAAARLMGLPPDRIATALGIAGSLSAGLKVNFGTDTKPLHAGLAAAAGWRAARMAAAGLTVSPLVLEDGGFPDLYGGADRLAMPDDDAFRIAPERNAVKLYPCCYAVHRIIGLALDARDRIGGGLIVSARLVVPQGSLAGLVHDRPVTPLQGKFSTPYVLAHTLLRGAPVLASFTDAALADPEVRALMDLLEVVEDADSPSQGDITHGQAVLTVRTDWQDITVTRRTIPGAPDDPPGPDRMSAKLQSCLDTYATAHGARFAAETDLTRIGAAPWATRPPTAS